MLNGIQLSDVSTARVVAQLESLHTHVQDYGGFGGHTSQSIAKSAEVMMASLTEVHDVMHALGYDPKTYGRGAPLSPEVVSATSCPIR
jgi:hypothetical protein